MAEQQSSPAGPGLGVIRVYPVDPVSAPRQVRRDIYDPSPHVLRYRAYQDDLRLRHVQIPQPFSHLIFVLPMAASWTQKKKAQHHGMPHQQRPDKDNLEKAVLDSVFGEDCSVWDGRVSKLWGERGLLIVSSLNLLITPPVQLQRYYYAVRPQLNGNPIAGVVDIAMCGGMHLA